MLLLRQTSWPFLAPWEWLWYHSDSSPSLHVSLSQSVLLSCLPLIYFYFYFHSPASPFPLVQCLIWSHGSVWTEFPLSWHPHECQDPEVSQQNIALQQAFHYFSLHIPVFSCRCRLVCTFNTEKTLHLCSTVIQGRKLSWFALWSSSQVLWCFVFHIYTQQWHLMLTASLVKLKLPFAQQVSVVSNEIRTNHTCILHDLMYTLWNNIVKKNNNKKTCYCMEANRWYKGFLPGSWKL